MSSEFDLFLGLDLPGFLGDSNFLLPWDVTVRAEKDKWPAVGEAMGKKSNKFWYIFRSGSARISGW